ncbi:MAG: glycosyltransferase family 4 protein [Chloroflexota bacterium]|nr:glycosyltransferase family 4 protein [Chloroflexota bacterium]
MRIAIVTWEYPPHVVGGLGTYAGAMAAALRAAGHEVEVFAALRATDPDPADGTHWARPLELTPLYSSLLNGEAQAWGPLLGELAATNVIWADRVRERHCRKPFDVVAIHDWLAAPAGLVLAPLLDVPLVFHVHSTERGRQGVAPSPIVGSWEYALGHTAAAVVTVSKAMREDLVAHGWPNDRVHAVWNGVDTRRYHPQAPGGRDVRARYGIPASAPVALFIGRLTEVKGVRQLAAAWGTVAAQHPDVWLVVLGSGELEHELRETFAHAAGSVRVVMRTEFVDEPERIAHYAASDVVVLPSTYEPFGLVAAEAMACGTPAVVGAQGVVGFREQVIAGGPEQTGLHVNGADPDDIAWGLSHALEDPNRLAAWGHNARTRAATAFTWEQSAATTTAVYQSAIEAHAEARGSPNSSSA